jgi:succinyl-CoA synthetase beta subunit
MRLQNLMQDETLEEIEINPLMVREQGAVAADAVIWKEAL